MRLVALVLLALSDATSVAADWRGYRPVVEADLPFRAYAENSIVQIMIPGVVQDLSETPEIYVTADLGVPLPAELVPPSSNRDELHGQISGQLQIENCRRQNIPNCPVVTSLSRSTGFFDSTGTRLTTCRHQFQNWFYHVSRANPDLRDDVTKLVPPILLYNADGELIYNSVTVPVAEMLRTTFVNDDPRLIFLYSNGEKATWQGPDLLAGDSFRMSDILELTADRAIVAPHPVTFRQELTPYDAKSYVVGFPGTTDQFPDGEGDSPGFTLMASVGYVRLTDEYFAQIETSNFTSPGASGSPIMSEQGDVLGVACSGRLSLVDVPETYGLIINYDWLRASWERLLY